MPTILSAGNNVGRELWTSDEFLDWLEPGVAADLIDGEKIMRTPVSLKHANLVNFLDNLLRLYIEARSIGRLYREVVAVRLSSRNTFLPDLAYISLEQVPQLGETFIPVAPTWVCEVLSPSTAEKDIGPKFVAYEEHGVREYWILDPETLVHRFFYREGSFFIEFAAGESRIASRAIPGFWIDRTWLVSESPPPVLECLRQVLGATSE
jgi:Uma2 family endonuclease